VRGAASRCWSTRAGWLHDGARIATEDAAFGGDLKARVSGKRLSHDLLVRELREGASTVGVCWDNVDSRGMQPLPA
jgi:hypothetical protein